jgi:hypothetical protein
VGETTTASLNLPFFKHQRCLKIAYRQTCKFRSLGLTVEE